MVEILKSSGSSELFNPELLDKVCAKHTQNKLEILGALFTVSQKNFDGEGANRTKVNLH